MYVKEEEVAAVLFIHASQDELLITLGCIAPFVLGRGSESETGSDGWGVGAPV